MKQQTVFETHRPAERILDEAFASTRLDVFWSDNVADAAPSYPQLSGSVAVDDAVVGGGYAGLWAAIKLKQEWPERRVILLEAVRIGWAASGRNGGVCEASITHGEANAAARWPDETGTLRRIGRENLRAIDAFIAEHALAVDWERTGLLTVANSPGQLGQLGRHPDPGVVALSTEEVRARVHSPTFPAGEFSPHDSAILHPGKLALELARHAARIGVEIHEGTPVDRLAARHGGPILLETRRGTVTAERAALCTNAFPSLLGRYRLHTVPVYHYALMSEALSTAQLAAVGWTKREALTDCATPAHYARLTADNRILWGSADAVYHAGGRIRRAQEDRMASHRRLASHFFTTFPQLAGLRFSHRWAGVSDASTRACAFFGQAHGGRVQHVAGFTGHGVGAAHFAADVVVDRLAGRVTERTELDMVRRMPPPFPPEPAAGLGRWSFDRGERERSSRS